MAKQKIEAVEAAPVEATEVVQDEVVAEEAVTETETPAVETETPAVEVKVETAPKVSQKPAGVDRVTYSHSSVSRAGFTV